jgi:hypothetical protein
MMRNLILAMLTTALTCLAAGLGATADPPSAEARARQAALDFIKAYSARDVDRACTLSGAPLLYDFTVVFPTAEAVRDHLRLCLRGAAATNTFTDDVRSVSRYEDFRGKIRDYHRKWIDQVLGREDFVVAVKYAKEPKFNVYLFVRRDGDKAMVAGWAAD